MYANIGTAQNVLEQQLSVIQGGFAGMEEIYTTIQKICSKYPRPEKFSDPGGDFSEDWIIFMFLPYGFMAWHGWKEKDRIKFYNGIAGTWAVHFFMFGLFLLAYISRYR